MPDMRPQPIGLTELTDNQLLKEIYTARGYVTEEMFNVIERRLFGETMPCRYDPSPERDPDALYMEIKHLRNVIGGMQNLMAKIHKELKEKR